MVKTPFISIVIRAFNRREFLTTAVESVINQTLPREEYEIVVVKNFDDEDIDRFLKEHGVIIVKENGIAGKLINRGLEKSQGEVVCFLDDDDRFTKNKLESVRDHFLRDPALVYLHNAYIAVDEHGNSVDFDHRTIDFSMSNISIRKDYVNKEIYDRMAFFQDATTYAMFLDSKKLIIDTDEKLTVYMVHPSTSLVKASSFEEWVNKNGDMYRKYLQTALATLSMLREKSAQRYMRAMISDMNMDRFQFDKNIKANGFINYLMCKDIPRHRRIVQFRSYVFIRVFGKYGRNYILNKRRLGFEHNYKESTPPT